MRALDNRKMKRLKDLNDLIAVEQDSERVSKSRNRRIRPCTTGWKGNHRLRNSTSAYDPAYVLMCHLKLEDKGLHANILLRPGINTRMSAFAPGS